MPYRTILVHLGDDADGDRRICEAIDFARREGAKLMGLYTILPMEIPGTGAGDSVSDVRAAAEAATAEVRGAFERRCEAAGVRHQWRLELGDPPEHLAALGKYADAVVITQDAPRGLLNDFHADLTEYLPFAVPAPILVLPRGMDVPVDPSRILLAWSPSRETARAVREALPLMEDATAVTVLTVQPEGVEDSAPAQDMMDFLKEHGVAAILRRATADDHHVGQAILAEAEAVGAGLVVMGVFSHPRLQVRILGGVSKHVLEHARVPLLIAH